MATAAADIGGSVTAFGLVAFIAHFLISRRHIKQLSSSSSSSSSSSQMQMVDALVVGAGFAGLYSLHSLRDKVGMKCVKVVERASGIGGTWHWNRYPGARCDSESHTYMYYFSKELIDEWNWTERYPQQAEILKYLNWVADRLNLRPDIMLDTAVAEARYDEVTSRWIVTTETGGLISAQFLISAVGCLSASSANIPQVEGLQDFQGKWYHTSAWPRDKDAVDFSGKRVGVVGTGSTGIQTIPVIANLAKHLTVFQRTANYSLPARHRPLTEQERISHKENSAEWKKIMTTNANGHGFYVDDRSALDASDEVRQKIYEDRWEMGGFIFRASFRDILTNADANKTAADFIKNKIRSAVKDPKIAEVLSDIDHHFGGKRPPMDSNYFETFNRENVELVDLKSAKIDRITAKGIKTSDGREHELDIIVFATGYDAITGPILRLNLVGRRNVALKDLWSAGPITNLGLLIPGFPNLFTITGPGSPSVLTNFPVQIEQHVEWITNCIRFVRDKGLNSIEPSDQASINWQAEVARAAKATLLGDVKSSWYLGANVPNKPRVFMPYAGGLARYRSICDQVEKDGYPGFEFK